MIRSSLLAILLIIALDFVQSTWCGAIAVFGVIPDLALLLVVWTAYRNGPLVGSSAGFVSGFALDCVSAAPLGFNAFIRSSVAWLASLLHGSFSIDRILLPFLLGLLATLAKAIATVGLHLLFGEAVKAYDLFTLPLWIEAGYNGLAAPLAFFLFSLAAPLLEKRTERA